MSNVIRLKTDSPTGWTVREALESVLEKIKNGDYKANKIYIALCDDTKDNKCDYEIHYAMAGMDTPEVLGWLHLHMNFLSSDD